MEITLISPPPKRKKTSTTSPTTEEERKNIVSKTDLDQQLEEYDALGTKYAAKLRLMSLHQRDFADMLINDILFKGLQNQLTDSTYISDYGCTSGVYNK